MTTLHRAVIKAYTAGTHKADVQLATSLPTLVSSIPVATDIPAAEVQVGRECAVLFFTDDNPDDAVVITVHGAVPASGAHGPSQHTEGTAWRDTYQNAGGDETEIVLGAADTVKRSAGASAAPVYSVMYSMHQYVLLPDAAIDADVVAGAQKQTLVSAGADETLARIVINATAAGGTALTVTLQQYLNAGAGVEDVDSTGTWTTVKATTVTASNKTVIDSAPSATIKSRGALRINLGGTVTGWKNVTATYEVKRPIVS